jgi:hypothetical protein
MLEEMATVNRETVRKILLENLNKIKCVFILFLNC